MVARTWVSVVLRWQVFLLLVVIIVLAIWKSHRRESGAAPRPRIHAFAQGIITPGTPKEAVRDTLGLPNLISVDGREEWYALSPDESKTLGISGTVFLRIRYDSRSELSEIANVEAREFRAVKGLQDKPDYHKR